MLKNESENLNVKNSCCDTEFCNGRIFEDLYNKLRQGNKEKYSSELTLCLSILNAIIESNQKKTD